MRLAPSILFRDDRDKLERLCIYVREHLSGDLSVPTLAVLFNYSESKLNRLFKTVYKKTLRRFILECRMRQAELYILEANSTIGEIARLVGYKNRTSFSHAFQSFYKCSPFELLLKQMRSDVSNGIV